MANRNMAKNFDLSFIKKKKPLYALLLIVAILAASAYLIRIFMK